MIFRVEISDASDHEEAYPTGISFLSESLVEVARVFEQFKPYHEDDAPYLVDLWDEDSLISTYSVTREVVEAVTGEAPRPTDELRLAQRGPSGWPDSRELTFTFGGNVTAQLLNGVRQYAVEEIFDKPVSVKIENGPDLLDWQLAKQRGFEAAVAKIQKGLETRHSDLVRFEAEIVIR